MADIPWWVLFISSIVIAVIGVKTILGVRVLVESISEKVGNNYTNTIFFILLPFLIIGEFYLYYLLLIGFNPEDSKTYAGLGIVFFIIYSFKIMNREKEYSYWENETKDGRRDRRFKDNELITIPQTERSKYLCRFYKYILTLVAGLFAWEYLVLDKTSSENKTIQTETKSQPKQDSLKIENQVKTEKKTEIKSPTKLASKSEPQNLKFLEGLAVFEDKDTGLKGYVNTDGKVVIEPKFTGAGGFYSGRAVVQVGNNHWGYIDKSGNWIVSPQFCMAGRFSEGLAAVYVDGKRDVNGDCYGGKWGFIAPSGKLTIPAIYDKALRFGKINGVVKSQVTLGDRTGWINGRGEWIQ